MFKYRKALVVGLALLAMAGFTLGMTPPAFAAKPSNAVSQFSTKSNPHGTWSYETTSSLLTTSQKTNFCGTNKVGFWSNGGSPPNEASVAGNNTKSEVVCADNGTVRVPAQTLNLDPEGLANVAVVWTAKKAGTYTIAGQFTGDDTSEQSHSVVILHNGTTIYTNTIGSFGQVDSFSQSVTVAKHDTLSFTVDTGGGANNLSTGLQATLTKS
jgi:hypothetical protein